MKSDFYYGNSCEDVAQKLQILLNNKRDFLTPEVAKSTRAVGDAMQGLVSENLESLLGDWCKEYSKDFARRSMADLAFTDKQDIYSVVDVKTHRQETGFNMPNLTSVERLSRLYESDKDVFSIIMIEYEITDDNQVNVTNIMFVPIEFLSWSCLTIGALGWGQIQISDSNKIKVNKNYSRKTWMLEFCEKMESFYPKEIEKINDRINRFKEVRTFWENKPDVWM